MRQDVQVLVERQGRNDVLSQYGLEEKMDFISKTASEIDLTPYQGVYNQSFQNTAAEVQQAIDAQNGQAGVVNKTASDVTDEDIVKQARNDVLVQIGVEQPVAYINKTASIYSEDQKALYQTAIDDVILNVRKIASYDIAATEYVAAVGDALFIDAMNQVSEHYQSQVAGLR